MVTYANEAKTRLLGVPADLIARHGAVSPTGRRSDGRQLPPTAAAPTTPSASPASPAPPAALPKSPSGLVYIGLADAAGCEVTEHRIGDFLTREEIRDRTRKIALNRLRLLLLAE